MKKLNPPTSIDHNTTFADIIDAKRDAIVKADLQTKKSTVLEKYVEYELHFNNQTIANITPSAFSQGDKNLLACYLSGGTKIAELKKHIKLLQDKYANEKCMYCRIKDPDSYDHFLPKEDYPEFCALGLNLIPCCTTCNKKKDRYWRESGKTGIINFYLDDLPSKQFLFADISLADPATPSITFKIDNRNKITASIFEIIKKHFKRLELLVRYKDKSDTAISELERTLTTFGKKLTVADEVIATLEYAQQLSLDYGVNYWKAVLYEEITKHLIFFETRKKPKM